MKSILSFLSFAMLITSSTAHAQMFKGVVYSMLASVGSSKTDHDIIISRREDNTIAFKYCHAFDKDGKPTQINEFSKNRFLSVAIDADPQTLLKFEEDSFKSDNCSSMGEGVYGINVPPLKDPETKYYDYTSRNWYIAGGIFATGFGIFKPGMDAVKSFENTSHANALLKRLKAARLSGPIALTMASALTAGGLFYKAYENFNRGPELTRLGYMSDEERLSHEFKSETDSMKDIRNEIEKTLKIAVDRRLFVPL